uniref:Uncharacterized protein n=1 Tax=Anguilla anguilla TaxID=7936 RepID=A0A0E9QIN7_ANGAN
MCWQMLCSGPCLKVVCVSGSTLSTLYILSSPVLGDGNFLYANSSKGKVQ